MLKLNFIFGNLSPESSLVLYGLDGIGCQYNVQSDNTITILYSNSENEYKSGEYSCLTFMYDSASGHFIR